MGAKLHRANLSGATLSNTNFTGANLSGAKLDGANFTQAIFGWTIFADNDLSTAVGLEAAVHEGPSTVGLDTIYRSGGNIPITFLRKCGVPEDFLTYLPSLTGKMIEFYSCFISYSHADKSFARRLYDALQGRGVRCWLDEHQILPGQKILTEVDRGIRLSDKVLLCCSKTALTSWWVNSELEVALQKEEQLWKAKGEETLALIPLNLDGYLFTPECGGAKATQLKSRLAANFIGWETDNKKFEEEFERLLKALRTAESRRDRET